MAIQVLHTPSELFRYVPHFDETKQIAFVTQYAEKYEHVATVDTADLEKAFFLTNTVNCAWWENEGVTTHFKEEGARSTSVGDVMIDTVTGKQYVVAAHGFAEMLENPLPLLEEA